MMTEPVEMVSEREFFDVISGPRPITVSQLREWLKGVDLSKCPPLKMVSEAELLYGLAPKA